MNNVTLNIEISPHTEKQPAQRGISQEFVILTVKYVECVHRTGIKSYIKTDRQLEQLSNAEMMLPERIAVIMVLCRETVGDYMGVVTVYKNRHSIKTILEKRKWKSNLNMQRNAGKAYS